MTIDKWLQLSEAITERREQAIQLIQGMVQLPSIDSEADVQEYIAHWWRKRDIEPDLWELDIEELRTHQAFVDVDYDYSGRPNQVVLIKGQGGGRSLTLNGHTDVVPVDKAPWTYGGPWSGDYVDGKVYGRGSVDMKGGLAIGMIVIDALLKCGIKLKGDLQMQFVADEENGGNGTLAAIQRGYRSDGTIFLEPTSPKYLVVSSRGAQFFRVTIPGVEGGIEYQFTTPNAIDKAFKIFQAVQSYALWRAAQADQPPIPVCSARRLGGPLLLELADGRAGQEIDLQCSFDSAEVVAVYPLSRRRVDLGQLGVQRLGSLGFRSASQLPPDLRVRPGTGEDPLVEALEV